MFDEAKRMVRADGELSGLLRVQRWHIEGPNDSIYRVLAADAELQQGLESNVRHLRRGPRPTEP